MRTKSRKAVLQGWIGAGLALAAFLLDQATKVWAKDTLASIAYMPVWQGVLRFTYVENRGMAFGLFQGSQTLLATLTGCALLGLLVFLLLRGGKIKRWPYFLLWILLGGALGNFYDRIVHGYVVDFIEMELFRFPVFNVSDMIICVAFAGIAIWILGSKEIQNNGRGEA